MIFVSPYLKPSRSMFFFTSGRSSGKSELIRITSLEVRLCTNSVSAGTDGRGGIRFSRYPFPETGTEVICYGTNSTEWPSDEVFTMPAGLRLGGFDASERGQPAGSRWNFDRWNGRRSDRQRPNSHNRRQDRPRLVRRYRGAGASGWNRNRRSRRQVHHPGTYRFARSLQLVHG